MAKLTVSLLLSTALLCCKAPAVTGQVGRPVTLAGSTYGPLNDVAGNRYVTDDVGAVKTALDQGDWSAISRAYTTGSATGSSSVTLKALATMDMSGSQQFDMFSSFYGSKTWIDDGVIDVISGVAPWTSDSARSEGIEKTLMNALLTGVALDYCSDALNMAAREQTADTQAAASWDKAWAYYAGDNQNNAPYATADKRAKNYGTYSTTAGLESTSKANEDIMAAFVSGQNAVRANTLNMAAASSAYDTILRSIQTTYIQASIRYAYKIDIDLMNNLATAEHVGEGWGFWRIVEPYISAKNAAGAQAITDMYDLSKALAASSATDYYYYCNTVNVLMGALPDGVTAADIGILEDTEQIMCSGVTQSPPAGAAAPATQPDVSDCTCSCCDAASCPSMTLGTFYAGSPAACTADACRSQFYFCPDSGTHNAGSEVTADFSLPTCCSDIGVCGGSCCEDVCITTLDICVSYC
jgi:hypothetical protein